MRKGTSLAAILAAAALVAAPAGAQEGGVSGTEGGAGVEAGDDPIDWDMELSYSSSEDEIWDEEEYWNSQSQLLVGKTAKGKNYSTFMHSGSVLIGGGNMPGGYVSKGVIPHVYIVQTGDTLIDIAAFFFGNPDVWPEIWAQNPEITNPNWIYPGQRLVLIPEAEEAPDEIEPKTAIMFTPRWKPGTVIYRNPGFVDEDIEESSGKIIGAFHENEYLSHLDNVYIKYKKDKAPSIGSTATIYEVKRKVKDPHDKKKVHGKMVKILGTVKVTQVDEEHRIAQAMITESIDVIERGDLVGPVKWKLATVAPIEASLDLEGKIIATIDPIEVLGADEVVFIDLGYEDGVMEGNKLTVVRKRDHFMESIDEDDADEHFPWEPIGEMMVLEALKHTSTCLLIESSWDIEVGDKVEMKRGQ